MNYHTQQTNKMAGVVQSPIPANTARRKRVHAKTKPNTFDLEPQITAVIRSVDRVIEGLTDEDRDLFLQEVIKTLQAML